MNYYTMITINTFQEKKLGVLQLLLNMKIEIKSCEERVLYNV